MPRPCCAHAVPLPCRAYATSMLRSCRSPAMPCRKGFKCVFPTWFTQCGRVWFTLVMPCPCHAPTMPFFSRPRHSTSVERRPVAYLPAFGFFRILRGIPRRIRHCRSMAGARYGMCELTARHGRRKAWARHGHGMGTACCVNWPLTARHDRETAWERHERGMGTACYVWIGLYGTPVYIYIYIYIYSSIYVWLI
jgi:hypothetical protein